jgi:hypothetical protein
MGSRRHCQCRRANQYNLSNHVFLNSYEGVHQRARLACVPSRIVGHSLDGAAYRLLAQVTHHVQGGSTRPIPSWRGHLLR